jgi:glycosyltransferase involved in cell wall biosynthesis
VRSWFVVTPEYPPDLGGVADYSRGVALGLAERGDRVRIFTPRADSAPRDAGVEVEALGDRFLLRSLRTLDRAFRDARSAPIVLLQYVPQAFGLRGLNLPFLTWLAARAPRLWVMFHEVAYPFLRAQPLRHDLLALGTRLMLGPIASRAERCLISTQAWSGYLNRWARLRRQPEWLPVPSNMPPAPLRSRDAVRAGLGLTSDRQALFHFGTYSPTVIAPLRRVLPRLLRGERELVLLGRGSEEFRAASVAGAPELAPRLIALGSQPAQRIVDVMAACDAGVFPFPDGVSGRRSSLMAALALGLPAVTTDGALTEALWRETHGVALAPALDDSAFAALVDATLADRANLARLGANGRDLYVRHFSRERALDRLCESA